MVGSQRMATFDDMDLERKLTVYDKGFDQTGGASYGEYITRSGDIWSPRISNAEPLRLECEHFVDCVRTGAAPRSDGGSGLRVVRVLEALQASLEALGEAGRCCAPLTRRPACCSARGSSSGGRASSAPTSSSATGRGSATGW